MIHQYKLSGYNIVLDVYSGSVHAVDDVAYDAIALIDQGSSREQAAAALAKKYADRADVTAADINDVLDDIDELTAAGQLFAPAAYAARWVAKNVVAAGLAKKCQVQLAYAIGVARPVSVLVETFGTGVVADDKLEAAVEKVFDLRPTAIIRDLDLRKPIYRQLAAYGHMGREDLGVTWEKTDRVDALKAALGL